MIIKMKFITSFIRTRKKPNEHQTVHARAIYKSQLALYLVFKVPIFRQYTIGSSCPVACSVN